MVLASYSAYSHGITSTGIALKMPNAGDTEEPSMQPAVLLSVPSSPGDGVAGADLCQASLGAAQGISSQALARIPQLQGSLGCKDKDRAALPSPGHTSALESGSEHSRLVMETRQQFPRLLNTQKTIISRSSLNVFLSTGIQ